MIWTLNFIYKIFDCYDLIVVQIRVKNSYCLLFVKRLVIRIGWSYEFFRCQHNMLECLDDSFTFKKKQDI